MFQKLTELINVKLLYEVARTEKDAAMNFAPTFQGLVKARGYHSWEILYVDESVCNGKDEDIWEDMILAK